MRSCGRGLFFWVDAKIGLNQAEALRVREHFFLMPMLFFCFAQEQEQASSRWFAAGLAKAALEYPKCQAGNHQAGHCLTIA